jgi:hypothetical protein
MSQEKNGNENVKKKSWVNKNTDRPTRIHCEIQYNNKMLENLRRTYHQNTERIDEIWKEYKETVEQLVNSLGKKMYVVPNHVNKGVIYLSKSVGNLSRVLCRKRKEMVDLMRILSKDLKGRL